jgi:hypothetical protein
MYKLDVNACSAVIVVAKFLPVTILFRILGKNFRRNCVDGNISPEVLPEDPEQDWY